MVKFKIIFVYLYYSKYFKIVLGRVSVYVFRIEFRLIFWFWLVNCMILDLLFKFLIWILCEIGIVIFSLYFFVCVKLNKIMYFKYLIIYLD